MEKVIGSMIIIAGSIVIVAALTALPVYYLWNWLMPEIFGLSTLTFMEALGVTLLTSCLFKSSSSSSSS